MTANLSSLALFRPFIRELFNNRGDLPPFTLEIGFRTYFGRSGRPQWMCLCVPMVLERWFSLIVQRIEFDDAFELIAKAFIFNWWSVNGTYVKRRVKQSIRLAFIALDIHKTIIIQVLRKEVPCELKDKLKITQDGK